MKLVKWINRHIEEVILVALLVAMAVILMLQIIMRRVVGSSLSWAEEVTRYMFVWSGFLSISMTIQNQSAMRLTLFVEAMPRMLRHIITVAVYVVMVLFFGYMTIIAFVQLGSMNQTSAALEIPMVTMYLAPFFGFALSTIRCIQAIWIAARAPKHPEPGPAPKLREEGDAA